MDSKTHLQLLLQPRGVQAKVARELEVSTGNVNMWKNGSIRPSKAVLARLADYFNVSIEYIKDQTDDPTPQTKKAPISSEEPMGEEDNLDAMIRQASAGLTDAYKRKLLEHIAFLRFQQNAKP